MKVKRKKKNGGHHNWWSSTFLDLTCAFIDVFADIIELILTIWR